MKRISGAQHLLSLLWCTLLTSVTADIGHVSGLLDSALDSSPSLANSWGQVLTVGNGITTSSQVVDGLLNKGALVETSSQEDSVNDNEDPRALLEENGRAEQAEPKGNLKNGNQGHGAVIVVLYKVADSVGQGGGLLLAGSGCGLWLDGWQNVGAGVGCYVEDRVDSERQNGKGDLAGEEPDKSHS